MPYSLSKRYAKALFDLALEKGEEERIANDAAKIRDAIQSSADFEQFLKDPAIPMNSRKKCLEYLWKKRVHTMTLNFLYLITSKNRLPLLSEICEIYETLFMNNKGIINIQIESGADLSKKQITALAARLKDRTQMDIQPTTTINSSILGGLKVREGDRVFDYTLKSQLEKFRNNLMKA